MSSEEEYGVTLVLENALAEVLVEGEEGIGRVVQQELKPSVILRLQCVYLHQALRITTRSHLTPTNRLRWRLLRILRGRVRGPSSGMGSELTGIQLEVLDDLQVLGVSMGSYLLPFLLPLPILNKTTQHSHLFVEVLGKIKAVLFSQSQLAVVVIQTLLTDSQHTGCLLQVDLLPGVVGLRTTQVQSPPSLHQLDRLRHCPLATTHVPPLTTVRLEIRSTVLPRIHLYSLPVTQQDHRGFEDPARQEMSFRGQFPERDEGIDEGVVEGQEGGGGQV